MFWYIILTQGFYMMFMLQLVKSDENKDQRVEISAITCRGIVHCQICHVGSKLSYQTSLSY